MGAITAMSLFAVGVFAFLWSFWNVVQRSREELVGVTQVYLLLGPPTPGRVRARMLGLLAVQIVVALATALSRDRDPDGRAGSSLAVGVLVPMFGIGLNGLWAAYHATFPPIPGPEPLATRRETMRTTGVRTIVHANRRRADGRPIGQNVTMADTATEIITIDASPERVWDIAVDIANYPNVGARHQGRHDPQTDDEGRPAEVEFRASALGRSTHYTLAYDYGAAPKRLGLEHGARRHPALDRRRVHVRAHR